MLEVCEVSASYGKVSVLSDVSLRVGEGETVALVGANGAGKTSVLRVISGLLRPTKGKVLFRGRDITFTSPEQIAALGISHVPEGRRVFPGLTVRENLLMGSCSWFKRGNDLTTEFEKVYSLFPRLEERRRQRAWSLSGGEQQMLAIGRALMGRPTLLLLDEPSLGLSPVLVEQVYETIEDIKAAGVTILLVEQNATMAFSVASRAYVLDTGRVVFTGEIAELLRTKGTSRMYLGT